MGDWMNLLLLVLEAALYFAVMAGLFRIRHRFGIGIVFCALGTMHFLETYLAAIFYIGLPGGMLISPGSIVLFSGKLSMLLLVYIREDAAAVRQPIYGLMAGNLLMVALVFVTRFHAIPPSIAIGPLDLRLMDEMGGLMIWGTILLFIDSILLILIYESIGDRLGRSPLARVVASLALVLTFDQIGFFTALHLLSGVPIAVLASGWIAKMGAAVLFGAMIAFYLGFVETARPVRRPPRLADVFDTLTYRRHGEHGPETAGRDTLTGLLDRTRFDAEGRSLLNEALRANRPVSVTMVAIDRFGDLNPHAGAPAGSDVLRQVAVDLTEGLRERDRAYRYDATEIVVLGDDLTHRAALLMAERLRRRISSPPGADRVPITVSIGIATAPADGGDLAALLRVADTRVRKARAEGGDRIVGHPEEDASASVARFPQRQEPV